MFKWWLKTISALSLISAVAVVPIGIGGWTVDNEHHSSTPITNAGNKVKTHSNTTWPSLTKVNKLDQIRLFQSFSDNNKTDIFAVTDKSFWHSTSTVSDFHKIDKLSSWVANNSNANWLVAQDQNNNYYFTDFGLDVNPKLWTITNNNDIKSIELPWAITNVYKMINFNHQFLLATDDGLYSYDSQKNQLSKKLIGIPSKITIYDLVPIGNKIIYANAGINGVYASDNGETFRPINGFRNYFNFATFGSYGSFIYIGTNYGVYISKNWFDFELIPGIDVDAYVKEIKTVYGVTYIITKNHGLYYGQDGTNFKASSTIKEDNITSFAIDLLRHKIYVSTCKCLYSSTSGIKFEVNAQISYIDKIFALTKNQQSFIIMALSSVKKSGLYYFDESSKTKPLIQMADLNYDVHLANINNTNYIYSPGDCVYIVNLPNARSNYQIWTKINSNQLSAAAGHQSQLVAIIVGTVLGGALLVSALTGGFIFYKKRKK